MGARARHFLVERFARFILERMEWSLAVSIQARENGYMPKQEKMDERLIAHLNNCERVFKMRMGHGSLLWADPAYETNPESAV